MPKRLGKFELPNRLVKVEDTATDTYATFQAEPFEWGVISRIACNGTYEFELI